MVSVKGGALAGAGILDGDIIIVARSIGPRQVMIVVAIVNGERCVRCRIDSLEEIAQRTVQE